MYRRVALIAMTLALAVTCFWAFYRVAFWSARGGQSAPLFSVRRYDPYGAAAMKELLIQRGVDVRTLEQSRIPSNAQGVLIQILPLEMTHSFLPTGEMVHRRSALQAKPLREWIEEGNTVIQFVTDHTSLMRECDVPGTVKAVKKKANTPNPFAQPAAAASNVIGEQQAMWTNIQQEMKKGTPPDDLLGYEHIVKWTRTASDHLKADMPLREPIVAMSPYHLPPDATAQWTPLATVGRIGTIIGMQKVGSGRLIVVTSPTPILNFSLPKRGNLAMLLALVGDQTVYVDEWSHGIGTGGTMLGAIHELGLTPVLLQVLFIMGLYTWSTFGFKRHELPENERKRSSSEQVVALAHLYEQVLTPAEVLARAREETLRRIAHVNRCNVSNVIERVQHLPPGDSHVREALAILQSIQAEDQIFGKRCRGCGYNLYGIRSDNCPECGQPVHHERDLNIISRRNDEQAESLMSNPKYIQTKAVTWLDASYRYVKEMSRERRR